MAKSREELITRVLEELGVLAAGQPPAAEDSQTIDNEIDPVLQDLASRGVYSYGDSDEIEEDAFVHLAVLIANSKARVFGSAPSEETRLLAERRLRNLRTAMLSGQPQDITWY